MGIGFLAIIPTTSKLFCWAQQKKNGHSKLGGKAGKIKMAHKTPKVKGTSLTGYCILPLLDHCILVLIPLKVRQA